jgi:hypothetical protein
MVVANCLSQEFSIDNTKAVEALIKNSLNIEAGSII